MNMGQSEFSKPAKAEVRTLTNAPTSEQLVAFFKDGTLAGQMARHFGLTDEADVGIAQERCVTLHNTGAVDLLVLVESDAIQSLATSSFFAATHFFSQLLPELETSPARMMACVDALVTHGGQDLAASQPNAAFRAWCAKDPRRAREVIAGARDADDLASRHLTFALEAINDIPEARNIALAFDDARRLCAITALGRIKDEDPVSRAETLAVFGAIADGGAEDPLGGSLLEAAVAILAGASDVVPSNAVDLVRRLVKAPGELTVHQAAHVLWAYRQAMTPDIVACLLEALLHLNPANKGTVGELDLGLTSLLERGQDAAAVAFVTQILGPPSGALTLEDFDSFSRKLVSGPTERLSQVVVQWLLLGTERLCHGLANALRGKDLNGPELSLRGEDLAISPAAQIFLCRKAIGWFFSMPRTTASVLVSVLRACDAPTALEIQKLMVDPLLINYSGVRDYLKGLGSDDLAKARVDLALAENDAYLKAVHAVVPISELQPSEHQRRIAHVLRADQMRELRKKANSRSVFLKHVRQSVLLYGHRSLSFIKDGNDGFRPVEMDLKPYGVSFEMPRMEVIDPLGLDYMLRVFRNERMAP